MQYFYKVNLLYITGNSKTNYTERQKIIMASVGFEKLKTPQEVKAMLRHCDKEERIKTKVHNNRDINLQATGSNKQLNRDYSATCKLYDDKIAYLDSLEGANIRKDRVTCFGLNVPVPQGLQADKEVEWFGKVRDIIKAQYGADNVLQCYIHRDEKHTYKNAETGQNCESRTHGHFYVIPEHNGKLNGKWFSNRANINKLNNSIQDMTQSDYGLKFMDGSKRKSKKTVEQLKNESEYRIIQEQLEKERQELDYQKWDLDSRETQLKAQEAILQDKLTEITEREEKSLKLASEASELISEASEIYEKAQRFYLNEQDWMNTQTKHHIQERNAEAERQKHDLRKIPTKFTDIATAYQQQKSNTDYENKFC